MEFRNNHVQKMLLQLVNFTDITTPWYQELSTNYLQ